jgi:hypothetical protein
MGQVMGHIRAGGRIGVVTPRPSRRRPPGLPRPGCGADGSRPRTAGHLGHQSSREIGHAMEEHESSLCRAMAPAPTAATTRSMSSSAEGCSMATACRRGSSQATSPGWRCTWQRPSRGPGGPSGRFWPPGGETRRVVVEAVSASSSALDAATATAIAPAAASGCVCVQVLLVHHPHAGTPTRPHFVRHVWNPEEVLMRKWLRPNFRLEV